jgi:MarR family transcriptional regulator, organic hydroperoxide resistance regulator
MKKQVNNISGEKVSLEAVEEAVGYHLRRAQTVVMNDVGARLQALGLTPRDYSIMSVVQANPGINAERIAESLPMKASNLSVQLLRLKKRGVIQRAKGEKFGRSHSLFLSKEGEVLLKQARKLHDEHMAFVESVLGRTELSRLIGLLRKLGNYGP